MRTTVLASTVCAGAALLWATTSQAGGTSWLPALWVPWLIVTIYAWRNYRPSTRSVAPR